MVPLLYRGKEDCCGCKACANICVHDAIDFHTDEYGFSYPLIDESKCVGCNLCVKTCDFQKEEVHGCQSLRGQAVRHKDRDVYSKSTSGGAFTALAEWVFSKSGIVYGCAFDTDMKPVHISARNTEQLAPMRGSKYVQSDTGLVYREIREKLEQGRYVLFSGTPCQVAGLNSFLGKGNTERLLTVDIICHGVPSPEVFRKYISYLERIHHRKIIDFQFRNKRFEWERPVISVIFDNGKRKWWFTTTDIYYELFNKSYFHRPSCFQCKYACDMRCGDFTIGDFWGYQKANLHMSIKEGITCCLLNTEKALSILEELNVNTEETDIDVIINGNPRLRERAKINDEWCQIMNEVRDNGFDRLIKQFRKTHRLSFIKAFIKGILLKPQF